MSADDEVLLLEPLTATRGAGCDTKRITLKDVTNTPSPKAVEPRVEPPQHRRVPKQQRRTPLYVRSQYPCALTPLSRFCESSKAQIDCLERLLHAGMPPRLMLDNAFAGLRTSVADDLETAIEEQWQAGAKHGEWMASQRKPSPDAVRTTRTYQELEQRFIEVLADKTTLERQLVACREVLSRTGLPPPKELANWAPEGVKPSFEEEAICSVLAEQEDLVSSLANFLATLPLPSSQPPTRPGSPILPMLPFAEDTMIDLDEMQKELDRLDNSGELVAADA